MIYLYQVDSFTENPFAGNPAGVCLLESPAQENWMRRMAMEMNLAETAFLYPEKDYYQLRWFTPAAEVDLCGHATLACAHILFERGGKSEDTVRFQTRSGMLEAAKKDDRIELDFPAVPAPPAAPINGLEEALGATFTYFGFNGTDYLAEISEASELRQLRPDMRFLSRLGARGIMVTARTDMKDADFISRFFAPGIGIDEDPVTGSAHCALGPYWGAKMGKTELVGYQASARGGYVRVRLLNNRVILGGHAVTVFEIIMRDEVIKWGE